MGVSINLLWLRPSAVGGSESYVLGLLEALSQHQPPAALPSIEVVATPATLVAHRWLAQRFDVREVRVRGGRPGRLLAERRSFRPSRSSQTSQDEAAALVHHLGGYVGGRIRVKSSRPGRTAQPCVVTIHDTQPLDLPQNFGATRRAFIGRALAAAVAEPNVICTVSEFTRRRLEHHFGLDPARCFVVPPVIAAATDAGAAPDPAEALETAQLPPRFVLYPAVTWAHKRHSFLVEVAERLAEMGGESTSFVLCGARGPAHAEVMRAIEASPARASFIHLGRVSQAELRGLYQRALALVFPSSYEGVGLPLLEAMANRCPTIVSEAEGVIDAAAGAACSLPLESEAWAAAIVRLRDDDTRRAACIERGLRRASQFAAQSSASSQLVAYEAARAAA